MWCPEAIAFPNRVTAFRFMVFKLWWETTYKKKNIFYSYFIVLWKVLQIFIPQCKYYVCEHFSTLIYWKYVPFPLHHHESTLFPCRHAASCHSASLCIQIATQTGRVFRETTGRERDWGECVSVLTHAAPNPAPPPLPGINPLLDSLITSPQLTAAGREMYPIIWLIHTRVTDSYTSIIGLTYGDLVVACQFTPLRLFTLSASRPYRPCVFLWPCIGWPFVLHVH